MARSSYFAEKRGNNNDPNYFNRVSLDEIRKNVKRIIKDIRYDIIQEYDLTYFCNQQIIQACIAESYKNYTSADVTARALNYYINQCLNIGFKEYPALNIINERALASQQQIIENGRAKNWAIAYNSFCAIAQGADIASSLIPIKMIDSKDIANL